MFAVDQSYEESARKVKRLLLLLRRASQNLEKLRRDLAEPTAHQLRIGTDPYITAEDVQLICTYLTAHGYAGDATRLESVFDDFTRRRLDIEFCNLARELSPQEFDETLAQFMPFPLPEKDKQLHEQVQQDRVMLLRCRVESFAEIVADLTRTIAGTIPEESPSGGASTADSADSQYSRTTLEPGTEQANEHAATSASNQERCGLANELNPCSEVNSVMVSPVGDSGFVLPQPDRTQGRDSHCGFLGGGALLEQLKIHPESRGAFFQAIGRQRLSLGDDCWIEVTDRRPNQPRFYYRANAPSILELASRYQRPKQKSTTGKLR